MNEDFSHTLRQIADALVAQAQARLKLLQIELSQETARIGQILSRSLMAGLGAFFTLQMIVVWIIAYFWDTEHRMTAITVLLLAVLGLTVFSVLGALKAKKEASKLLTGTVDEFSKDRQAIEQAVKTTASPITGSAEGVAAGAGALPPRPAGLPPAPPSR